MSTIEQTEETHEDPTIETRIERVVATRRFETQISAGAGRTVSFRIAPFGEIAQSADGLGGMPRGVVYQEELMPGLYDKQLKAANRILLNFEHQQGIAGIIGHGVELERRPDGYHASFRVHETPDGDKALMLVKEGVLHGASVESFWLKSVRAANGVVQRVKAHLEAVAVCREGAYASAVLTGIRSSEQEEGILLDESLLPIPPNTEVLKSCKALGIRLPAALEAHLAEADTPADAGTSEDDTRQSQETPESSEE